MAKLPSINEIEQDERYPFDLFEVGDHVCWHLWSDSNPMSVIKVSPNGRRVWVREDNAKLVNPEDLKFHVGGFAGHCSNQSAQKYEFSANPDGRVLIFSLRLWRGRYVWALSEPSGRMELSKGWGKFYDYNF